MPTNLLQAIAVSVILAMSPGAADCQGPQPAKAGPGISAEVRGTLRFENGRGYFITVPAEEKGGRQTRVWLQVAEDKVLVRKLQGLDGKDVTAKGKLAQMPKDVGSSVPPLGLYLANGFTIEATKTK
jgi:hypothetical protein